MKPWVDIYQQHTTLRAQPRTWTGEVRKRLQALAKSGHCDSSVAGRFTNKRVRGLEEWRIKPRQPGDPIGDEPLRDIAGMAAASLSVLAMVHGNGTLRQFDIRATGQRANGTPWLIAVHLSDDAKDEGRHGLGACGHPALHCHVGPDFDAVPNVRVPLPALGPVELLDWVLSQLVPSSAFEPAPWAAVQTALKKDSA